MLNYTIIMFREEETRILILAHALIFILFCMVNTLDQATIKLKKNAFINLDRGF